MSGVLGSRAAGAVAADRGAASLVGPNAVTQLGIALQERHGERMANRVFAAAGVRRMLIEPPVDMVDECVAASLFASLHARLGKTDAAEVASEAGARTADYLLENRIPRPLGKWGRGWAAVSGSADLATAAWRAWFMRWRMLSRMT